MAAAPARNVYPVTLDDEGKFSCDLAELKNFLIHRLDYGQINTERVISDLLVLLSDGRSEVLYNIFHGEWRYDAELTTDLTELTHVILQAVNPDERLNFIKKQTDGTYGLTGIAINSCETFQVILHSISGDEKLLLLQMTEGCDTTILHLAAFQ